MKYEDYYMRSGEKVTIPIPHSYADVFKLVKSDIYRVKGKIYHSPMTWLVSFSSRNLKHLFWVRMASYKGVFYPFAFFLHKLYSLVFCCNVHAGTKIGYGFYIGHAFSISLSNRTIIGNNVNISQLSNIGNNSGNGAIIGDNVYVGPLSSLIEDVQIGHDTIIGAGSIVTKDISCCSTAVGNPARIIGENRHPEYVGNRFSISKID